MDFVRPKLLTYYVIKSIMIKPLGFIGFYHVHDCNDHPIKVKEKFLIPYNTGILLAPEKKKKKSNNATATKL